MLTNPNIKAGEIPSLRPAGLITHGNIRINIETPENFARFSARKIAAEIRAIQETDPLRDVNITVSPGNTVRPVLAQLAKAGTVERARVQSDFGLDEENLTCVFKQPMGDNLVFKYDFEQRLPGLPFSDFVKEGLSAMWNDAKPFMVEWPRVRFFHIVEYVGFRPDSIFTFKTFMWNCFFKQLPEVNSIPEQNNLWMDLLDNNRCANVAKAQMEDIRRCGGLDIAVLAMGHNGHIAYNEPGTNPLETMREVELNEETRTVKSEFIPDAFKAVTSGIADLMDIRKIFLLAYGASKSTIARRTIFGDVTPGNPCSFMMKCNTEIILDSEASGNLVSAITRSNKNIDRVKTLLEQTGVISLIPPELQEETAFIVADKYYDPALVHLSPRQLKELEAEKGNTAVPSGSSDVPDEESFLIELLSGFASSGLKFEDFHRFIQENILKHYISQFGNINRSVDNKEVGEYEKLKQLFDNTLRVFRYPLVRHRTIERKELITHLLLNIFSASLTNVSNALRGDISADAIFEMAIQHPEPYVYNTALEAIFEFVAVSESKGRSGVFKSFSSLIDKSDDYHNRFAKLIFELLVRAKRREVDLFYRDIPNGPLSLRRSEFFELAKKITLKIAASSKELNNSLREYFLASRAKYPEEKAFIAGMYLDFGFINLRHKIEAELADRENSSIDPMELSKRVIDKLYLISRSEEDPLNNWEGI